MTSPKRASQLVEAGIWLRLSGDTEGARKLFEQALALDPGHAQALELLKKTGSTGAAPVDAMDQIAPAAGAANPFKRSDRGDGEGPAPAPIVAAPPEQMPSARRLPTNPSLPGAPAPFIPPVTPAKLSAAQALARRPEESAVVPVVPAVAALPTRMDDFAAGAAAAPPPPEALAPASEVGDSLDIDIDVDLDGEGEGGLNLNFGEDAPPPPLSAAPEPEEPLVDPFSEPLTEAPPPQAKPPVDFTIFEEDWNGTLLSGGKSEPQPEPEPVQLEDSRPGVGSAMDLVVDVMESEPPPPAPPPPPRRPHGTPNVPQGGREVETLLEGARDLIELDDHTGALELILKAHALSPNDPEVMKLRERSERTLQTMWESKVGDPAGVPQMVMKSDEIIWLNLDHRAGFVLAQIDGSVTFEDLFSLSGMSRIDTLRVLAQLLEQGVISVTR